MGITGTTAEVLPLTREWIEMSDDRGNATDFERSPSYEGVD